MNESTQALIILVLVMLLLIVLAMVGSRFLMKRALNKVVNAFRDNQALNPAKALSPEDLGLKRRGIMQFGVMRDYKPMALQLLMKGDIVQETEDGRLYLSEERLAQATPKQQ